PIWRQSPACAAAAAVALTVATPALPVKAFELPELTTSIRPSPPSARLVRHHSTGAEAVLDVVNTPAACVPGAIFATRRSVRPLYLMPAATVPSTTPPIGGSFA